MRNISLWGRQHPQHARCLIIISHFCLAFIAILLGFALADAGHILSSFFIYALCFVFTVCFIFYPSKKEKQQYRNFYFFRKSLDLILISTSFLLVLCGSNHFNASTSISNSPFATINAIASIPENQTSIISNKPLPKKKVLKSLKQKLKDNIRHLRKEYKDASKGERTVLIVLSVLVALGLLLLVAGLACNLSCSGSGAAATAVAILGTGLIIFLLVIIIKRINRGKPKKDTLAPAEKAV